MMWKSIALLAVLSATALPALAQDARGVWRTEATDDGYLEVEIAPCGPHLCGKILRARNLKGEEGPYPHLGRTMIWDMIPETPSRWSVGKIWDPSRDVTVNGKLALQGDRLTLSGCFLAICRSQDWTRLR
jgi:uncharacterized protein (DUF2147 family)